MQHIIIPAYYYPGNVWKTTVESAGPVSYVIMNPGSGPGNSQDLLYVKTVQECKEHNIKVLGYVHTQYSNRDSCVVKNEIKQFVMWYDVDGIFLDETPTSENTISYFIDLCTFIRSQSQRCKTVILNPGTVPSECYVQIADVVCTHEHNYENYKHFDVPQWTYKYPATKYWHIIHGTPKARLQEVIMKSKQLNCGNIFITQLQLPNPFYELPSYWHEELSLLQRV